MVSTVRAVAIAMKEQAGEVRVLLVKNAAGEKWVLPGGHVESGETGTEAARREALEESGFCMVGWGERIGIVQWKGERIGFVLFREARFECRGEREARWVSVEAASRMLQMGRTVLDAQPMVGALWTAHYRYQNEGERSSVDAVRDPQRLSPSPG